MAGSLAVAAGPVPVRAETTIQPPAAGFVPAEHPPYPRPAFEDPFKAIQYAWGYVEYGWTRVGPAGDIAVIFTNRFTGYRYRTATDALGRYKVRLAAGTYDVQLRDDTNPERLWFHSPEARRSSVRGVEIWPASHQEPGTIVVGAGYPLTVVERPRFICHANTYDWLVDGREGFAAGTGPANVPECAFNPAHIDPNGPSDPAWNAHITAVARWAGAFDAPESATTPPTTTKPGTPGHSSNPKTGAPGASQSTTPALGLARSGRPSRSGRYTGIVDCPRTDGCAGTLTINATAPTRHSTPRTRTVARQASIHLPAGINRVTLRPTRTGRALQRTHARRALRATIIWTSATNAHDTASRRVALRTSFQDHAKRPIEEAAAGHHRNASQAAALMSARARGRP